MPVLALLHAQDSRDTLGAAISYAAPYASRESLALCCFRPPEQIFACTGKNVDKTTKREYRCIIDCDSSVRKDGVNVTSKSELWEQARTLSKQVAYMREANRMLSVLASYAQQLGKHIEQNAKTPDSTRHWVAGVYKVAREKADHTAAWLGEFVPQLDDLVNQINESEDK